LELQFNDQAFLGTVPYLAARELEEEGQCRSAVNLDFKKKITVTIQGCSNFPKIQTPPRNSKRQDGDKQQVPYSEATVQN